MFEIRLVEVIPPYGEPFLAFHRVYVDPNGNTVSVSRNPVTPVGRDVAEVIEELGMYLKSLEEGIRGQVYISGNDMMPVQTPTHN